MTKTLFGLNWGNYNISFQQTFPSGDKIHDVHEFNLKI